ncbi:uncharacterized protein BJ171DRAFT_41681 [Polychytrium aggregatum]|uniref:uncharacterized protein n=1 Tax=Polychytrium aggregatum TaxID=110093 RepID=UPI0022FF43C4|nr:uncharacterized protein BJ171DRAFT_41681 [Polychytrium aggregatum]KAI9206123.1 hypothetical protein BJ171DRAFT_41681 [Polychytrium aggregatum]
MSDLDKELEARLQRLKNNSIGTAGFPTDDELTDRLRKLTGHDPIALAPGLPKTSAETPQVDPLSDLLGESEALERDLEQLTVPRCPVPGDVAEAVPHYVDFTSLVLTSPVGTIMPTPPVDKTRAMASDEVSDLIRQFQKEVELERKYGPLQGGGLGTARDDGNGGDDEFQKMAEDRLRSLKEFTLDKSPEPDASVDTAGKDRPAVASAGHESPRVQLRTRKNELQALGAPPKPPSLSEFKAQDETESRPWCCICNQDATLICESCDDDYYCSKCWKQGHYETTGLDPELRFHIPKKLAK